MDEGGPGIRLPTNPPVARLRARLVAAGRRRHAVGHAGRCPPHRPHDQSDRAERRRTPAFEVIFVLRLGAAGLRRCYPLRARLRLRDLQPGPRLTPRRRDQGPRCGPPRLPGKRGVGRSRGGVRRQPLKRPDADLAGPGCQESVRGERPQGPVGIGLIPARLRLGASRRPPPGPLQLLESHRHGHATLRHRQWHDPLTWPEFMRDRPPKKRVAGHSRPLCESVPRRHYSRRPRGAGRPHRLPNEGLPRFAHFFFDGARLESGR